MFVYEAGQSEHNPSLCAERSLSLSRLLFFNSSLSLCPWPCPYLSPYSYNPVCVTEQYPVVVVVVVEGVRQGGKGWRL